MTTTKRKTDHEPQRQLMYTSGEAPWAYGDDTATYARAGAYLAGPGLVRDWGCGTTFFRRFLGAPYEGIDGAPGAAQYGARIEDLRTAKLDPTPKAHMRHVLEHNWEWRFILANFLSSFTDRGVLTLFVPPSQDRDTHDQAASLVVKKSDPPGLHLYEPDLTAQLTASGRWIYAEDMQTDVAPFGWERIYFIEQRRSG